MNCRFCLSGLLILLVFGLSAQDEPPTVGEISAMPTDTNKVYAWIDLSKSAMRTDLERGASYGDSALQLARRLDYERGIALAHRQMGVAAYYGSRLEEAIDHYKLSLEYYRKYNDRVEEANILTNIGLAQRNQGDSDASMRNFFAALEIKQEIGDSLSIASTLNKIGENNAILGNAEEAERYFLQALRIYENAGPSLQLNSLILNLAGFYREQGQSDKSLELLQQVRPYFEENGPLRELGRTNYILGGLHRDRQEFAQSEDAFRRAQDIFDTMGAQMRSIGCINSRAEIAAEQGYPAKAIDLARESLQRSEGLGLLSQDQRAYRVLTQAYQTSGNYQLAYENLLQQQRLQDSIVNAETNRTILELEEKYQSEVRERQLAELAGQNEMNEIKLRRQRNQQVALGVFVILILIISGLLYNQYRQKKQTSEVLLEKNNLIQKSLEEKEVLMREIHHRVKNNLQFIASMFNLQTRFATDPEAYRILNENKDRINSMAMLHQKLYQEDNLTGVDMESYVTNLSEALVHSLGVDRNQIDIDLQVEELILDVDTAIPIGLILNECITNAFKHAFSDSQTGKLTVSLWEKEDKLELRVQDNGRGMPKEFNPATTKQFGFELIRSLASRLKADLSIQTENGTTVALTIGKYQKS